MFLIPSTTLTKKLNISLTGLWTEQLINENETVLASKLPMNVIKAVYRGVKCSLIISVIEVEQVQILYVGLQIEDEVDTPITVFGPFADEGEQLLIEKILTYQSVKLYFFNELSIPVLGAICSFDNSQSKKVLVALKKTNPYYLGMPNDTINSSLELSQVIDLASDIFQKDIYSSENGKPLMALFKHLTPLSLTISEPIPNYVITTGSTTKTMLSDNDEGGGQEQSIYALIACIYPNYTFHSPEIEKGTLKRELTDIIGFDFESKTICLVESKAMYVLGIEMNRSGKRRVASVIKQINKALDQLKGAIKKIRLGEDIFNKEGQTIIVPERNTSFIHAIILISEMYFLIDWCEIADIILKSSEQDQYKALFHVLDLQELQYLVNYSKDAKVFNSLLMQRWVEVKKRRSLYIRGKRPIEYEQNK